MTTALPLTSCLTLNIAEPPGGQELQMELQDGSMPPPHDIPAITNLCELVWFPFARTDTNIQGFLYQA